MLAGSRSIHLFRSPSFPFGRVCLSVTRFHFLLSGDDLGIDVAAVHSSENGSFLRYVVSMLGYGFHADLLRNDDKLRWMGPRRYDYSGNSSFPRSPIFNSFRQTVRLFPFFRRFRSLDFASSFSTWSMLDG